MIFFQRSNGNLLILKDLIHLQSGVSMSHILQGGMYIYIRSSVLSTPQFLKREARSH